MTPSSLTYAVCAMGKRPFDGAAVEWITALADAGAVVHDHRAKRFGRERVVADLNGAADVVIYVGHGRARGWSGYQTIRRHHVEALPPPDHPSNAVFAFACRTAGADEQDRCFGRYLVDSRRTRAYLGWEIDVPIDAGLRLANRMVAGLTEPDVHTLGDLVAATYAADLDDDEQRLLDDCRLIGDADAPVGAGHDATARIAAAG